MRSRKSDYEKAIIIHTTYINNGPDGIVEGKRRVSNSDILQLMCFLNNFIEEAG